MRDQSQFVITVLSMSFLGLFGCSKKSESKYDTPSFSELSTQDVAKLEQQRAIVLTAAKQHYGTATLTKTKADLSLIQRLVNDKVFSKTQTYELQSLGVAYGDVIASELGMRWVIVTDQYGRDPTLRYKDTTIQINALTMISKRVEDGSDVNLTQLLEALREDVVKEAAEFNKTK